eukprot:4317069-Pyramimonas_sp.AAC.1
MTCWRRRAGALLGHPRLACATLEPIAGWFRSMPCGCRAKASELTAFLGTPCRPVSWTGAVFRPTGAACVRSREVHGSHQLCYWPDKDVLFCA